jgi:hypothetical protein
MLTGAEDRRAASELAPHPCRAKEMKYAKEISKKFDRRNEKIVASIRLDRFV